MKRNLILILTVLLAAVAGFIYFTKDEVAFSKETSMYKAIPLNTPFFVELSSFNALPNDNLLVQEIKSAEIAPSFFSWIEKVDTIIQNNNIPESLKNDPVLVAFSFSGKNDLYPVFIKKAENNAKKNAIEDLLSAFYPDGEFAHENRNYSGYKIVSVVEGQKELFQYCFAEGLFIASGQPLLVEQAIRQLNLTTLLDDVNFIKANKTVTAQSEISVYINHIFFPQALAKIVSPKPMENIDEFGNKTTVNLQNEVKDFQKFSSWSELDVKFEDENLLLNGISTAADSLGDFLSVFHNQEGVKSKADEMLSKNTAFFTGFSFSDKTGFFKNLESYFSFSDKYYKREEQFQTMGKEFGTDFKLALQQMVKNEVVVALGPVSEKEAEKTVYFILSTEGKTAAEEQMNNWLNSFANKKSIDVKSLKSGYNIDDEITFTIYKFPFPSFPGIWLGKPFGMALAEYAAFYDNNLVFCNSEKGLQEYLHDMVLGATLAKDVDYLKFKQKITNHSNINVYLDVNYLLGLAGEVFSSEIQKQIERNKQTLRKIKAVNWQVVHEKDIFFNSMVLSFQAEKREDAKTIWQSNIGTGFNFKPQFTINYDNPSTREVILQDSQNRLLQITGEGRIRWAVPLSEPVLSEIFQVDLHKNGNLQYLFNTKSKLYLIDRNGNNVANFPVAFRSPATNGVNVFDYDNKRDYRYFVACEDKKVYAFDAEGKLVNGWDFGQTDFPVTTPVQHFRVEGKDYIVFKDKSRIYIQDRKGKTRVNVSAKFENLGNALVLNVNGVPKIVVTDKTGKVYYIYFNGKYNVKNVGEFSEDHFFTVDDLNGNGVPDFVFVDGKELTVVDENGKKLFTKKFNNPIKSKPAIYSFSSSLKEIGIVDSTANRIYLFNPDGKLHEGFPMQGNSEFSIGKINALLGLNLIVGSEGGNLFNYKLK